MTIVALPSPSGPSPVLASLITVGKGTDTVEIGNGYAIPMTVFTNNIPVAPVTLTLTVRDPSGNTATYTLASGITAAGVGYACQYAVTLPGRHSYTVDSTGPVAQTTGEFMAIEPT